MISEEQYENFHLADGEVWAERMLAELATLPEAWRRLAWWTQRMTGGKPTRVWEERVRELLTEIGPESARRTVIGWLSDVDKPRTKPFDDFYARPHDDRDRYHDGNVRVLRSLIWLTPMLPADAELARAVGGLVEPAIVKVNASEVRSLVVANAAAAALARIDHDEALGQLGFLVSRVWHKGVRKLLNKGLDAKAAERGLTRDEVEELVVPTYGLTEIGGRTLSLGEASAELRVHGKTAAITWRDPSGKALKNPSAAMKRDHPEAVKELKASAKEIGKALVGQSERIDRQFVNQRRWTYRAWRERYLDHFLLGDMTRSLLWTVDGVSFGIVDDRLVDVTDEPVEPTPDAVIELWHPIGREVADIVAWRDWVERHGIVQPFKQAHREVYLLTDAERGTGTYSNRFAAHILRQAQFNKLAAARGWRHHQRAGGGYTDGPPTAKDYPSWDLRAEYWVEGLEDADIYAGPLCTHLSSDQVRFTRGENSDPLPLTEIPAIVFSEAMRDVDLFVGVTSVGNDPQWFDGGPQGRFRGYWHDYSFGELSGSAQSRREVLERLVPRLAIADRATVAGRFLVVRGDLRTYKIHLGSGNILMEPGDRYLCIVAKQAAKREPEVLLPFDGDRTLSLILSKALLLARDTEISDPSITSQIKG